MKKILIGILSSLSLLIIIVFLIQGFERTMQQTSSHNSPAASDKLDKDTEKSASFAIYTNNIFRVFTAPMYHQQSEDVYIEAENPNKIIVVESDVTWNDFFKTLPFSLTSDCLRTGTGETFCTNDTNTLKFYLNGERNDDVLTQKINHNDSLVVSYGPNDDPNITEQIIRSSSR